MATSNTNGDNYIKLYKRIDNGSWELVRTINNDSAEPIVTDITNALGHFVDIQFKIEIYNDTQAEDKPTCHNFQFEYNIIEL